MNYLSEIHSLPGLRDVIELGGEGNQSWFRARGDSGRVVLRASDDPDAKEAFRREVDFHKERVRALPAECSDLLMRPLNLLEQGELAVLVCEDPGGNLVSEIIARKKFDLHSFLFTGAELAGLLQALHETGLVHGSLAADRILFASGDAKITLAGVGANSGAAPEDDLRALGILFHLMLSGGTPGSGPEPLHEKYRGFPVVISKMILKLRGHAAPYQSAAGLYPDLRSCAQQLEVFKTIEDFEPGRLDRPLSYS